MAEEGVPPAAEAIAAAAAEGGDDAPADTADAAAEPDVVTAERAESAAAGPAAAEPVKAEPDPAAAEPVKAEPEPAAEPEPEPAAAASVWSALNALDGAELTGGRATLCAELEAMAADYLAKWDTWDLLAETPKDAEKKLKDFTKKPTIKPAPLPPSHEARKTMLASTNEKGKPIEVPLTMVKLFAEGLTPQHLIDFLNNIQENMPKMMGTEPGKTPMMIMTDLARVEGAEMKWVRVKPPKPMSPRSSITAQYAKVLPDGSLLMIASTKGNEELLAKAIADGMIKDKDVKAITHIDYNLCKLAHTSPPVPCTDRARLIDCLRLQTHRSRVACRCSS